VKKARKKGRRDKSRKFYFLITALAIVIVGSLMGWLLLAQEEKSISTLKEPTKAQLVLLEKVYNEFRNFQYIPDVFPMEWEGYWRERFERLCGRKLDLEITVETDYYQIPSETLKRRGGDCEDLAILFVSIAKNLGISARAVSGSYQGPRDPKPLNHHWTEIYYRGKWQIVDPTLLVIRKKGIPFKKFIDNPEEYPTIIRIYCKYDDKVIEGILPRERAEAEKERVKKEAFDFLQNVFRNKRQREPSEIELKEISLISEDLFKKGWAVVQAGYPEDPRTLIQPDNPEVKSWIEKIKSSSKG